MPQAYNDPSVGEVLQGFVKYNEDARKPETPTKDPTVSDFLNAIGKMGTEAAVKASSGVQNFASGLSAGLTDNNAVQDAIKGAATNLVANPLRALEGKPAITPEQTQGLSLQDIKEHYGQQHGLTPQEISSPVIDTAGKIAGTIGGTVATGAAGAGRFAIPAFAAATHLNQVTQGKETPLQGLANTAVDSAAGMVGPGKTFLGSAAKFAGAAGGAGAATSAISDLAQGHPIDAERAIQSGGQNAVLGAGLGAGSTALEKLVGDLHFYNDHANNEALPKATRNDFSRKLGDMLEMYRQNATGHQNPNARQLYQAALQKFGQALYSKQAGHSLVPFGGGEEPPQGQMIVPPKEGELVDQNNPTRFANKTVGESDNTHSELKGMIEDSNMQYEAITNHDTLRKAQEIIDADPDAAFDHVLSEKNPSALTHAMGIDLMRRYQNAGQYTQALQITEHMSSVLTKQGQAIQAAAMYSRLTPEGILRYAQRVAKKAGKTLSPEDAEDLTGLANRLQNTPEGEDKEYKTATLVQKLNKLSGTGVGQKIATLHTLSQLLNLKSAIKVSVGHMIFGGLENGTDAIAASIDNVVSKFTGKRTFVFPDYKKTGEGFKEGVRRGAKDALSGVDTSHGAIRSDSSHSKNGFVFDNKILQGCEKALNLAYGTIPRGVYTATAQESLDNQLRAATKNAGHPVEPTPDMIARAHEEGLYRSLQDKSVASQFTVALKKVFNMIGIKGFGAGDIVLKYAHIPGNLASRALAYSPAGYVNPNVFFKVLHDTAHPFIGKPFDQRQFVQNFSKATVGTAGLGVIGYMMAKSGLISSPGNNKNIDATKRTMRILPHQLNASALMRFHLSGYNPAAAKAKPGDHLVTYDWAQPMAVGIDAGANIAFAENDRHAGKLDSAGRYTRAAIKGFETLADAPMLQGLERLFGARDDDGNPSIPQGVVNTIAGAPATFVPSVLNVNNKERETYDDNPFKQALNQLQAKITEGVPVVGAQNLPLRRDNAGEPMERYPGGSLLQVMASPFTITTLKSTPEGRDVLRIFKTTGEVSQAPRVVGHRLTVTIDGKPKNLDLTGEQISDYQEYIGKKTKGIFSYLVKQPYYTGLSDSSKGEVMAGLISNVNQAAKYKLFADRPDKALDPLTLGIITKQPRIVAAMISQNLMQANLNERVKPFKQKMNDTRNSMMVQGLGGPK